jgi:hypothetical protein
MIRDSKLSDDLDVVKTHYKPSRTHIVVKIPTETIYVFNPNQDYRNTENTYLKDPKIAIEW